MKRENGPTRSLTTHLLSLQITRSLVRACARAHAESRMNKFFFFRCLIYRSVWRRRWSQWIEQKERRCSGQLCDPSTRTKARKRAQNVQYSPFICWMNERQTHSKRIDRHTALLLLSSSRFSSSQLPSLALLSSCSNRRLYRYKILYQWPKFSFYLNFTMCSCTPCRAQYIRKVETRTRTHSQTQTHTIYLALWRFRGPCTCSALTLGRSSLRVRVLWFYFFSTKLCSAAFFTSFR